MHFLLRGYDRLSGGSIVCQHRGGDRYKRADQQRINCLVHITSLQCDGRFEIRSAARTTFTYARRPECITNVTMAPSRNTTKSTLAIPAAPAAIPPKPKTAATKAITRKTIA